MENKQTLYVLVGCAGSGKSTYSDQLIIENPHIKILSSDKLRIELTGAEYAEHLNQVIFSTLKTRLEGYCANKLSCLVDATSLSEFERRPYVSIGKRYNMHLIGVFFNRSREVLIAQNEYRALQGGRYVAPDVIDRMLNKITKPSIEEGFNLIIDK